MPKWDKTRNYYADLELPPSASSEEIKKQFKRLALKYHPDRNPGREAEVNPKFQVIQSAHEILSDATLKRQYDEARLAHAPRYPSSSGVKGNPWQDAGKAYPPPPRRPNYQAGRPTSASQRYETFTANMPRPTRSRAQDDSQFRKNNAEAWDNLRPNTSRKPSQAPPAPPPRPSAPTAPKKASNGGTSSSATNDTNSRPVPVPPRTAYQKQKAEAAFGTSKKTGFTPRSQDVADEPPVTSKNYHTNRTHSYLFTESESIPGTSSREANMAADADKSAWMNDVFTDNRQRTPYHNPGGEKTSLFDSNSGQGHPTSAGMPPGRPVMPGGYPSNRTRSSSPAISSSNDGDSENSMNVKAGVNGASNRMNSKTYTQPKADERSKPKTQPASNFPPPPTTNFPQQPTVNIPSQPANGIHDFSIPSMPTVGRDGHGPSVYAPPNPLYQYQSQFRTAASRPEIPEEQAAPSRIWSSRISSYHLHCPSSEEHRFHDYSTLLPLEMHQRMTLDRLVDHARAAKSGRGNGNTPINRAHHPSDFPTHTQNMGANSDGFSSFNFTAGSNTGNDGGDYKAFTRNSTDNINTRFVDDEVLDDWQFKAGSSSANEANPPSKLRPQSRSRPNRRQTPLPKPNLSVPVPETQGAAGETNTGNSRFEWNERIGPEHFEPQPTNSATGSPTRRPNSRKNKSFKMTAGTAAVVDDEESEEWQEIPRPSGASSIPADAMDIDSPAPTRTEDLSDPANDRARKYSIEPHREEWRAGDVNGVAPKTSGPTLNVNNAKGTMPEANLAQPLADATKQFAPRHAGSEDTEEFIANFGEFKKVEPFVEPAPSGLRSFDDLKSTLPFESRPSEQIPPDLRPAACLLEVPTPPVAPRLPPTMGVAGLRPTLASFRKYAQDFNNYMSKWEIFNNKVVTHLATRRQEYRARCAQRGAHWLENTAANYLIELDQDLDVQKKYTDACIEHRKRVAEYLEFKDRVK